MSGTTGSPTRHSGFGIASCVLAVISWLCWLSLPLIGWLSPGGGTPADGLFYLPSLALGGLAALVGCVLGVAGLLQPHRKHGLAVAGIVMSLAPALPAVVSRFF